MQSIYRSLAIAENAAGISTQYNQDVIKCFTQFKRICEIEQRYSIAKADPVVQDLKAYNLSRGRVGSGHHTRGDLDAMIRAMAEREGKIGSPRYFSMYNVLWNVFERSKQGEHCDFDAIQLRLCMIVNNKSGILSSDASGLSAPA